MNMNKKQINFFNHCSIILTNFPENNFSVGSKGQPEQSRIQHYTNSIFLSLCLIKLFSTCFQKLTRIIFHFNSFLTTFLINSQFELGKIFC